MSTLPSSISELIHLVALSLDDNVLSSLPSDLCLPNLTELRAQHNQLTTLPSTIGKCSKLKRLLLKGNRLDSNVWTVISGLSELVEFSIDA